LSQVEALASDTADTTESVATDEITVCICTYRRQELLERLLVAVAAQRTDGLFQYSCVIVDNDERESAREVVERLQPTFPVPIRYAVEPARNFAMVRNRAVGMAAGSLFAFVDDDEVPNEDWLLQMLRVLRRSGADAVLGPVRPYFKDEPPSWIVRSRICERPAHPTGMALHWWQTRTGNVLLRAAVINEEGIQFDPAYASGGEDVDFFRRAAQAGKTFVWCEDAPVYELVPESRLSRSYHLKRALLQGSVSAGYSVEEGPVGGKIGVAVKALIAAVSYTVALPVLFLCGDHIGMKYLIKDCHHISRLLAMSGLSKTGSRKF